MEKHVRIQVFIPTRNCADLIEETLDSIWDQDYPKEDIYVTVMDFGSTDGTYEKLMTYSPYHLGIYQDITTTNPRIMIEKMVRIKYVDPKGWYSFKIVLYPGDVLYSDYLKTCTKALIENQAFKPESLICEVDKVDENGNIIQQPPLFEKDRIIDGNTELKSYVDRGFQHQIQCMVYHLARDLVRQVGQINEQRWWNKWAEPGNEKMVVYIQKPLVKQRCIEYDDELEEILLRWENIITIIRTQKARFGTFQDDSFYIDSRRNFAQYAIWRSFISAKRGRIKDAEDCLLISGVLDSTLEETELYRVASNYISESSTEAKDYLESYFAVNGWN